MSRVSRVVRLFGITAQLILICKAEVPSRGGMGRQQGVCRALPKDGNAQIEFGSWFAFGATAIGIHVAFTE